MGIVHTHSFQSARGEGDVYRRVSDYVNVARGERIHASTALLAFLIAGSDLDPSSSTPSHPPLLHELLENSPTPSRLPAEVLS